MKPILVFIALLCGHAAAVDRPPNIIFLFADDLGWGDLACYGHPCAQTPHLDRLSGEGTRFMQTYATGVTCCPSRTGFMTGKFPATFRTYPANEGFGTRPTVSAQLKNHGYATGHFGKWHIGPETKAGTYGFDVIATGAEDGEKRCRDAHIYNAAIRFIEQHKDGPFYLNVWGHITHHPVDPSPELVAGFPELNVDEAKLPLSMREKLALCKELGENPNTRLRSYLAEVKALDAEVGRLLRRLDELGLRENTIVVFSSDQGPAPFRGRDGKKAADSNAHRNLMGSAGPFRGGKHSQYEGGVRIPFIVRWPGQVPAGRVDETSVLSGADWLPTLCALVGAKFDADDLDGENAAAAWRGQPFARSKPLLWKTSRAQAPGAIRDGRWKFHLPNSKRGEPALYDLDADPGEQINVADRHPAVVRGLTAKVEAWQATLPKSYDKTGADDD